MSAAQPRSARPSSSAASASRSVIVARREAGQAAPRSARPPRSGWRRAAPCPCAVACAGSSAPTSSAWRLSSGRNTWWTTSTLALVQRADAHALAAARGQRVRPVERARAQLVAVEVGAAHVQQRRAELVLARSPRPARRSPTAASVRRIPCTVRLRQAHLAGQLDDAQPPVAPGQQPEDRRSAFDRLDRAQPWADVSERGPASPNDSDRFDIAGRGDVVCPTVGCRATRRREERLLSIFGAEVIGTALLILLGNGVVAACAAQPVQGAERRLDRHHVGLGHGRHGRRVRRRPVQRRASESGGHARVRGRRRHRRGATCRSTSPASSSGAFIGAALVWIAYLDHWKATEDPGLKLACFSTAPAIRNHGEQHHHRDHRHLRARVRRPGVLRQQGDGRRPAWARCWSACWCSASGCRSAARRATRSTRRATSGRGSCTRSCRSRARAARTGATRGSRSSAPLIGGVLGALAFDAFFPAIRRRPTALDGRHRAAAPPGDLEHRGESLMAKYAAASTRARRARAAWSSTTAARSSASPRRSTSRSIPKPGWVEHDANEIWARTQEVVDEAMESAGASADDIAARRHHQPARDGARLGPQHGRAGAQRDRVAGHAHGQAGRRVLSATAARHRFQEKVGLPLATYFSGPKMRWILDNVDGAARPRRLRRPAVRQHGHLADLEPHRRHGRRPAHHGRRRTPAARC